MKTSALRVSRAKIRLTIYRSLYIQMQMLSLGVGAKTIGDRKRQFFNLVFIVSLSRDGAFYSVSEEYLIYPEMSEILKMIEDRLIHTGFQKCRKKCQKNIKNTKK